MVPFLVGIVVLVWTLDNAVAISVTVLVAFFLTIIMVVTVLPIFVKRCPYKSPTAWAFVHLVDVVPHIAQLSFSWVYYCGRYIWYIYRRIFSHILLSRIRSFQPYTPKPTYFFHYAFPFGKTWRTHEIRGRVDFKALREGIALQLAREATHLDHDGTFVLKSDGDSDMGEHHLIKDFRQSSVLVRALEWVSRASPGDSHIAACIDQCMTSVYPGDSWPTQHSLVQVQGIALTDLHAARVLKENQVLTAYRQPRLDLVSAVNGSCYSAPRTHPTRLLAIGYLWV